MFRCAWERWRCRILGLAKSGILGIRNPKTQRLGWRQNEKSLRRQLHQLCRVFELATGGVNIAAAWTTDKRRNSCSGEYALKCEYPLLLRRREGNLWSRIQRDQVHFGAQAADKLHHLACVLHVVVNAAQQNIFEGEPLAIAQWKLPKRSHKLFDRPLLCDWHDLRAQNFIGSVQRHGELGPDWLSSEVGDARDDPRGRNRHARLGNADCLNQQPYSLHKVVVIQEGLALAHED